MTWTCDDTRRQLLREDEWPEQAFEHLASCAICQEMSGSVAAVEPSSRTREPGDPLAVEPSSRTREPGDPLALDALWARTERQIAAERGVLSWLRCRPTQQRFIWGLSIALAPAVAQLAWARRWDLEIYPLPRLLLFVGVYSASLAIVERELLVPLFRPKRAQPRWLTTALTLGLPFLIAATAPAYVDIAATTPSTQISFLHQAWLCLRYGTLLSIPAILVLFVLDRQLGRTRGFGVAAAGVGAIVGNLALLLHCPIERPAHQMLGHAGIAIVLLVTLLVWVGLSRLRRPASEPTRDSCP